MERFCQGESRAFDVLFERHARSVQGYLTRLCGSSAAADDCLQQTMLSIVRSRARFEKGARFRPWLYAIATNAARDSKRRGRNEQLTSEGQTPEPEEFAPAPDKDPGLEAAVRRALATLPENQREAILLHRFEGMTFGEIALALGASESAVKVRAHRGYEKLREQLRGVWEDSE